MDTDRRVTRHEPIVVNLDIGKGKDQVISIEPLGWRRRNDLADLILQSSTAALNQLVAVSGGGEDGVPASMTTQFFDSMMDYAGILAISVPDLKADDAALLTFDQMVAVIDAALEVNGLDRLSYLVDPDRKKGPTIGESESPTEEPTDAGEKTD